MEARRLIGSASYGPDTLKALFQAFDEAWAVLAPRYGNDAPAISAGRIRLANIVLSLARNGSGDVDRLRETALQLYQATVGGR